jgi:chitinase
MDPCLCTHLIYSFVKIKNNKLIIGWEETSLIPQMIRLKEKNPNLKVSISVGGWGEGVINSLSYYPIDFFCSYNYIQIK